MLFDLFKKKWRDKKAFTLVEISISMLIAIGVLFAVYRFLSSTRQQYMYGTVNLQNLQEARLAINWLRRDFSCACPKIMYPPTDEEINVSGAVDVEFTAYENLQKLRKQMFSTPTYSENERGQLIQIGSSDLFFHKFVFGSFGEKPKVELVRYNFIESEKSLERIAEDGSIVKFSGFESVLFELYTHPLNSAVPILWVNFKIHEGENIYGSDSIGSALELTTSITSPYISSTFKNSYWRYEVGHQ